MEPEKRIEILRRENLRLRRSVEELAMLNELTAAIAAARDLETVMQTVVRRALRVVGAEQGVITLIDETAEMPTQTLIRTRSPSGGSHAFRPNEQVLGWMHWHREPLLLNDPNQDERFPAVRWADEVRSMLCVPMLAEGRLVGVLTIFNKKAPGGFRSQDRRLLMILAGQSAQAIERARLAEEGEEVLRLFGQHTAPAVVEELRRMGSGVRSMRAEVCVMFLDIRGFTTFAEQASPEDVVAYLNGLFDYMIEAVNAHGGIIHQLLGDGFMAIFGAPISHGNDCQNAVDAALAIVEATAEKMVAGEIPPTRLGIGLHTGEVVAGAVGSVIHKEYKITGDVVNLAARIEAATKRYEAQVLVSEAVWRRLDPPPVSSRDLGPVGVRGRLEPVRLFHLA